VFPNLNLCIFLPGGKLQSSTGLKRLQHHSYADTRDFSILSGSHTPRLAFFVLPPVFGISLSGGKLRFSMSSGASSSSWSRGAICSTSTSLAFPRQTASPPSRRNGLFLGRRPGGVPQTRKRRSSSPEMVRPWRANGMAVERRARVGSRITASETDCGKLRESFQEIRQKVAREIARARSGGRQVEVKV
jgi:hypothetical protein